MLLKAQLAQAPQTFDFIQVVRLLRGMKLSQNIFFWAEPMPAGYAREITAVEQVGSVSRYRLGLEALSGVKGVLPAYFHEELLSSLHDEDRALDEFLNIFNHRYFQLLHQAIEKGHLQLREEQESQSGRLTRLAQRRILACLSDTDTLATRSEQSYLPYTLQLGMKVRSLTGLRRLLTGYFELLIHVEAAPQSIYRLPAGSATRLGQQLGQNQKLGQGSVLGRTATLCWQCIEIRVEPRNQQEYFRLQSDEHFSSRLRDLAHIYLREYTDLRLYLFVRREFIDQPRLSADRRLAVRLGEGNCLAPERYPEQYKKILLQ
ncbi:type VI secretion system baseplate subunit TssG [Oceanospirillum beijerinckii]|uniref:type VI secretion system baseplate subunit TssG n=1 Tax=Oceanospirillum beijerinckii TaxID=64976 RepID=UPI00040AD012|nr:type VI secretion system baseplate subunit TssG [Oceanospirillum beijerinckii]